MNLGVTLKSVVDLLGPWPTVGLILGLLAVPFLLFAAQSVQFGPLIVRLRRSVHELDQLSIAMAESRIAELDVTSNQWLSTLSDADRKKLKEHGDKLRLILAQMTK